MNRAQLQTHFYVEPAQAGKSLREVGIDYLKVESRNITSRWFHSDHDVDLFLWIDEDGQVIKQQVSFCGQIVEWNILDGIKTGVVIEEEMTSNKTEDSKSSEAIRFDKTPQKQAVFTAVEVIENIELIEDLVRNHLLFNFGIKNSNHLEPIPYYKSKPSAEECESAPATFWSKLLKFLKIK